MPGLAFLNVGYQHHIRRADGSAGSLAHRLFQGRKRDSALGDDTAVEQHDRDAPVVEIVQAIIGVDVGELRIVADSAEGGKSLVTEVAASAGDQDQPHWLEGRLAG